MSVVSRLSFRLTPYASRLTSHLPLLALIALAIYPILTGGMPTTGDGLNHYYRLVELNWHISHGDLYPRWFTNMGYGYGLPVLNFYAPLTYYVPLIFRPLGLTTALQLSYALALTVAILGAYAWAGQLPTSSPQARTTQPPNHPATYPTIQLLIAAAYGLSPYFYFNIFHRGAYPETWALAILPWLLWSTHRLIASPNLVHLSFVIFHLSFVILTHTLSALIFTPIITLYALAIALSTRNWRALGFWFLGFGVSLLLTAFFTLPVLFESQYIQLQRAYSTGDLDYHRNFLTLAQLFSAPPNFDPQLVFNSIPPSLAWPQAILGIGGWLLGIGVVFRYRDSIAQPESIYWVLGLLGFGICFFTLSFTEPLWNLFPFTRLIQFPWRLVGPASLFFAAVAGLGFTSLSRFAFRPTPSASRPTIFVSLLSITAFFFFSLAWTYHADFARYANSIPDLLPYISPVETDFYERSSGQLGASSTGEYLPMWVSELPNESAVRSIQYDLTTGLASHLGLVPFSSKQYEQHNSLNYEELTYTATAPTLITYNLFYFPGWVAEVDGVAANIQPSIPNGLITITVPAGEHTLKLYRQLTPPQLIGTLISAITLLALIVLVVRRLKATPTTHYTLRNTRYALTISPFLTFFLLGLIVLRWLYLDTTETIFHYTNRNNLPNPNAINFGDQLELIGYEYPQSPISNSPISITLYWRALAPLTTNYSVSVQLADRFGVRFGQSDSQHPNGVPTSRWQRDQYARDTHTLTPTHSTPPGTYHLLVTVYSTTPLSVIQDSAPIGVDYDLGTVQIASPPASPPGPLALIDSSLSADSFTVGDPLTISALWFTGDDPLSALTATVNLIDDSGQTFYQGSLPPTGIDYPTDQWQPNTEVRYPITLTLPPDLPAGTARVRLALTEASGAVAAGPFDLGSITINVPQRSFDIPPMQVRVDHDFEDAIRLLGYDLKADSITLYWQSLKTISRRLTVFVHALNEDGGFASGQDAQPVRSTTSWLPGEVITDIHPIVVGNRFEVGLYEPISGERFGEVFVTLP